MANKLEKEIKEKERWKSKTFTERQKNKELKQKIRQTKWDIINELKSLEGYIKDIMNVAR